MYQCNMNQRPMNQMDGCLNKTLDQTNAQTSGHDGQEFISNVLGFQMHRWVLTRSKNNKVRKWGLSVMTMTFLNQGPKVHEIRVYNPYYEKDSNT